PVDTTTGCGANERRAMGHNRRVALGIVVLLIWIYLATARGWFWRMREEPRLWSHASARVVAVIPARNEAEGIGAAVESLAKQQYGGDFHIVVVDDHSEDATADRARAATADRLSVIPAPPLEPGWSGKLWALAEGVRFAARFQPDYLLLTDADIVH